MVEWIEAQKGFPAILELLAAYREGATTEKAFAKVLGTTLEDLDRAFFAHLRDRFGPALAKLDEFEAQRKAGAALFQQEKLAEAAPLLRARARRVPRLRGGGEPVPVPGRTSTRSWALPTRRRRPSPG